MVEPGRNTSRRQKGCVELRAEKDWSNFNELLSIDLTSAQMKSPTSRLLVTVFQCGQLRDPGNPIGEVVLPLHQITNTEKTKWYPLANKKENGEIQMSCFFKKKKALNALGIEQLDDTVMRASLPCNDHLEVEQFKTYFGAQYDSCAICLHRAWHLAQR